MKSLLREAMRLILQTILVFFLLFAVALLFITSTWGVMNMGTVPEPTPYVTFVVFQQHDKEIITDMSEGSYFSTSHWYFDTNAFGETNQKDLHIWLYCVENKEIYYDTNVFADEFLLWGQAEKIAEMDSAPILTVEMNYNQITSRLIWIHEISEVKHLKYEIYKKQKECFKWIGHTTGASGKMEWIDKKYKIGDCYLIVPTIKEKVIYGGRSNIACLNDTPLPIGNRHLRVQISTIWGKIKRAK